MKIAIEIAKVIIDALLAAAFAFVCFGVMVLLLIVSLRILVGTL